jgi:hypothetical protein
MMFSSPKIASFMVVNATFVRPSRTLALTTSA